MQHTLQSLKSNTNLDEYLKTKIKTLLLGNSWFKELPDYLVCAILNIATLRRFQDGDIIHYYGDEAKDIYAILTGSVKVSSISAEGNECVFRYLAPASWFGEIGVLDRSRRTHDAIAISQTTLLVISEKELQTLLIQYPIFYKFLASLLCRVVRTAFTMLNDSTLLSVSARLAKRLVSLAEGYGVINQEGILISLHFTQDDLATLTHSARQTINKRLVEWEKLGWLKARYGKITITNIQALKQLYIDE